MKKVIKKVVIVVIVLVIIFLAIDLYQKRTGVSSKTMVLNNQGRIDSIPKTAVKMTPTSDTLPPIFYSNEWEKPVPVPGSVNTAGAEDSPFITPDGKTLYFFFTPDPNIPPEKQLLDGVTGIWVSRLGSGGWEAPTRVVLEKPGELSLDGCEFVQNDIIWFCAARQGFEGINFFTAQDVAGNWLNIQYVGDKLMKEYKIGEMTLTPDGNMMYFHSDRPGGKGNLDIWSTTKVDDNWQVPVNISSVNTAENDGWPFITPAGNELWFLRTYQGSPALFRSKMVDGNWAEPELIVSQFAGEPTLDSKGNLYFVHHYYKNGKMLEADIYVAYKKSN